MSHASGAKTDRKDRVRGHQDTDKREKRASKRRAKRQATVEAEAERLMQFGELSLHDQMNIFGW